MRSHHCALVCFVTASLSVCVVAASSSPTPSDVLMSFEEAWCAYDCSRMYDMLAPQPSGNWYANAAGPDTYTVLNRTNIVSICEAFSPPAANNGFVPLPLISNANYLRATASISFGGLMAFKLNATSVCNIVWQETFTATVNSDAQIASLEEMYDAQDYARQYAVCQPPPSAPAVQTATSAMGRDLHTHGIVPASAGQRVADGSPILSTCAAFMDAYTTKDCDALPKLAATNFTLIDGAGAPISLTGVTQACNDRAIAEGWTPFVGFNNTPAHGDITTGTFTAAFGFSTLTTDGSAVCSAMGVEVITCEAEAASPHQLTLMRWQFDFNKFNAALAADCAGHTDGKLPLQSRFHA